MKKFTIKEKLKQLFNKIKPSTNVKTVQIPIYGSWIECRELSSLLSCKPNGSISYTEEWFNYFKIPKEDAIAIHYDNNSMEPNIKKGWSILVNTANQTLETNTTYAVIINDKIEFRSAVINKNSATVELIPEKGFSVVLPLIDVVVIGTPEYILGVHKVEIYMPVINNLANYQSINKPNQITEYKTLDRAIQKAFGWDNSSLVIYRSDDSFISMLTPFTEVIIDLSKNEIKSGGIHLVRVDNNLTLRRIFNNLDGTIVLKCENPSCPDIVIEKFTENIDICGKAVMLYDAVT